MKEYENGNNGIDSEVDADLKEIKNESTEDNNQLRLQRPKKNIDIKRLLKKTAFLIAGIVIGFILGAIGSEVFLMNMKIQLMNLQLKMKSKVALFRIKMKRLKLLKIRLLMQNLGLL